MTGSCPRSEAPLCPSEEPLILVVDYSQDGGELYASYFEHIGFRVARMCDVDHALPLLASRPAAVVVDLGGRSLNDCDIVQHLRAAALDGLVIAALTSHSNEAEQDWMDADGPDIVLAKPCVPSVVAHHVRSRLDARTRAVSGFPEPFAPESRRPRSKRPRPVGDVTPAYNRAKTLARDEAARRRSRA